MGEFGVKEFVEAFKAGSGYNLDIICGKPSIEVGSWVVFAPVDGKMVIVREVMEVFQIDKERPANSPLDRIHVKFLSDGEPRSYWRSDLELAAMQP